MQKVYDKLGVPGKFRAVQIKADHNYNQETREYVYAFFQEHLLGGPKVDHIPETPFKAEPRESMTLPAVGDLNALAELLRKPQKADLVALRHSFGIRVPAPGEVERKGDILRYTPFPGEIRLGGDDVMFGERGLLFGEHPREAPCNEGAKFQRDGWKKWMDPYPATYYRTELARRAQDVLAAIVALGDVEVSAKGEAAVAALIARALIPGKTALDLAGVDDAKITQPGWLRLGGLQGVALLLAGSELTLKNPPFDVAPLKAAWAAVGRPDALKVTK